MKSRTRNVSPLWPFVTGCSYRNWCCGGHRSRLAGRQPLLDRLRHGDHWGGQPNWTAQNGFVQREHHKPSSDRGGPQRWVGKQFLWSVVIEGLSPCYRPVNAADVNSFKTIEWDTDRQIWNCSSYVKKNSVLCSIYSKSKILWLLFKI